MKRSEVAEYEDCPLQFLAIRLFGFLCSAPCWLAVRRVGAWRSWQSDVGVATATTAAMWKIGVHSAVPRVAPSLFDRLP